MKILIAGFPRSGSTLLCKQLGELESFKNYKEIFHRDPEVMQTQFNGDFTTIANKLGISASFYEARQLLINHPGNTLKAIENCNRGKHIGFKVFSNHLSYAQLESAIKASDKILVLERNLIHAYCSILIASSTNTWEGKKTNDIRVYFYNKQFVWFINEILQFYNQVHMLANKHNIPIIKISYETLVANNQPILFLSKLLEIPIKRGSKIAADNLHKKQDSRNLASDKVHNVSTLLRYLSANGIQGLNTAENTLEFEEYQKLANNLSITDRAVDYLTQLREFFSTKF